MRGRLPILSCRSDAQCSWGASAPARCHLGPRAPRQRAFPRCGDETPVRGKVRTVLLVPRGPGLSPGPSDLSVVRRRAHLGRRNATRFANAEEQLPPSSPGPQFLGARRAPPRSPRQSPLSPRSPESALPRGEHPPTAFGKPRERKPPGPSRAPPRRPASAASAVTEARCSKLMAAMATPGKKSSAGGQREPREPMYRPGPGRKAPR